MSARRHSLVLWLIVLILGMAILGSASASSVGAGPLPCLPADSSAMPVSVGVPDAGAVYFHVEDNVLGAPDAMLSALAATSVAQPRWISCPHGG